MRGVLSLAVVGVLLAAAAARGQEAVSEAEFVEGVRADHPALRAVGEELARAEAARRRAVTLANPRAEFGREHPEDSPRQDTWTLAWTPPLDGRRGLARDAADAALLAARERTTAERARLRRDLRKAFADWSLARERTQVLTRQLAMADDLAAKARLRAQEGEESGLAAGRLALAAQEVRGQLVSARTEEVRAQAVALGWRPDLTGRQPTLPSLPPEPPDLDPSQRPELRALHGEARQAALEARLARRFWTFPELQAGQQRLELGGTSQRGLVVGVAWTIPLFDRNQAGRMEAARRKEIAEARLALAISRAERELKAAREAYEIGARAAEEAARATTNADRLIDAAAASFRAGEGSLTDLLDTLRAVREAQLGALEILRAALEAHRELELWTAPSFAEGATR